MRRYSFAFDQGSDPEDLTDTKKKNTERVSVETMFSPLKRPLRNPRVHGAVILPQ